jgi:hypothetical protein
MYSKGDKLHDFFAENAYEEKGEITLKRKYLSSLKARFLVHWYSSKI